ncbi:fimbrial protein [Proteus faecis]|uniref:Fimbrial protein n=1 Tax=Proteus faecis TaxID=2050967 RepID=A0AAW7CPP9_9GAMM|nr:fimbrial protein [Proteus faecis]MDL5167557.1 fimbrial protein [Proteus faecis]MDL5275557.1 fimbrial protein [Proteus faecis]MDL5279290.1 fimbrial protein [Proteus faecis]MDL5308291.1 fimbrial protein [Proteus faecis]MDL5311672.1 fimbrial protein [Proteus faecis]
MDMEQRFNTSKAVLILLMTTFTGVLSSTAVANTSSSMFAPKAVSVSPGMVPVNITGYVIAPPPCVINNGQMVEVNFGEIMSTRIDGSNYKQPVVYKVECTKMPTNMMKISVGGNSTGFDSNALRTNITGLGVRILYQNKTLRLGQTINFTYPNAPTLEAIPVRDYSAKLTGGDFSATATLRVEYQ